MSPAASLLSDVHKNLPPPTDEGKTYTLSGSYQYYHYGCDGFDDRGWGCGYRTLQTLCSWVQGALGTDGSSTAPSIPQIQMILVSMEDKPASFISSKEWIGSVEVSMVLSRLYDVLSKIIHVPRGQLGEHVSTLAQHFESTGSPIMMGGDQDNSSKGILGVHLSPDNSSHLLVLDPHFWGQPTDASQLIDRGYLKWQAISEFQDSSFYNLCLPQLGWFEAA